MSRNERLSGLLAPSRPDRGEIARLFEEAARDERVRMIESVGAPGQAKLWTIADPEHVSIDELVPRTFGPLEPVIFHGKNSLPAFTIFQKRFCRPSSGTSANE